MEKEKLKKNADRFNAYVLSLGREEKNEFLFRVANELDISLISIQNMRYGVGGIGKLKREKIEQIAGCKIFGEE
ncbi:MAG: hypothetical protein LBE13_07550 [Bacteroidales bacterium]|jgi:hypothetical protein|nr:hypothetical protein [Bacteroidales bacterium]